MKDHQSVVPSQEATLQDRLIAARDVLREIGNDISWSPEEQERIDAGVEAIEEAADALDAKDARIAELEANANHWLAQRDEEVAKNAEQQREIERLTDLVGAPKAVMVQRGAEVAKLTAQRDEALRLCDESFTEADIEHGYDCDEFVCTCPWPTVFARKVRRILEGDNA